MLSKENSVVMKVFAVIFGATNAFVRESDERRMSGGEINVEVSDERVSEQGMINKRL